MPVGRFGGDTLFQRASQQYRRLIKKVLFLTKDEQIMSNRMSLYANFFLTCFYVFTMNMGATLAIFYTFMCIKGKWNVALIHLSFVALAYLCELAVYSNIVTGLIEQSGALNYTVTFNYLYIIAFASVLKLKASWKEKLWQMNEVKTINFLYMWVTFYYLMSQVSDYTFSIPIIEYMRFYFLVIVRGYMYSTYHYMSHISNVLWSVHKGHHFAITRESGDGNTISIIEFAVAWIPLTGSIDPVSECVLRFLHILGDISVHTYRLGKYHQLHHLFHNTNVIIPVIGQPMYRYVFPREFKDLEHEEEFRENYDEYADTFDIYYTEDNDVEQLNVKMAEKYSLFMDRVAARQAAKQSAKLGNTHNQFTTTFKPHVRMTKASTTTESKKKSSKKRSRKKSR